MAGGKHVFCLVPLFSSFFISFFVKWYSSIADVQSTVTVQCILVHGAAAPERNRSIDQLRQQVPL